MGVLFLKSAEYLWLPATRQLFQRAHIQIAVMEIGLQLRHVFKQETAILADAVATNWRFARRNPLLQELDGFELRRIIIKRTGFHPFHQTAARMSAHVPLIHQRQLSIRLMNRHDGPLRQNIQIASVTRVAISMMRSRSGSSPVISRSIQIKLLSFPAMIFPVNGLSLNAVAPTIRSL